MFKALALYGIVSTLSCVSFAGVNLGTYSGQSENNTPCSIEISKGPKMYVVDVAYQNEDSEAESCNFKADHANENKKELRVSGSEDSSICKVRVKLANDGTPIEADMGVGRMFQFGFDTKCSNLQKDQ